MHRAGDHLNLTVQFAYLVVLMIGLNGRSPRHFGHSLDQMHLYLMGVTHLSTRMDREWLMRAILAFQATTRW